MEELNFFPEKMLNFYFGKDQLRHYNVRMLSFNDCLSRDREAFDVSLYQLNVDFDAKTNDLSVNKLKMLTNYF